MKKFRFSLEHVLNYRENIEEQKKEQLARALQREQQEKETLNQLIRQKQQCIAFNLCSIDKLDEEMKSIVFQKEAYLSLLDTRIEQQENQLKKSQRIVENCRIELRDATIRKKILENLQKKRFNEYQQELQRGEQKLLDEVGIISYRNLGF